MSSEKKAPNSSLIGVHIVGASVCILITAGSAWFAADSVARRRGLFLSARHELTSVRAELDETASQRTTLTTKVRSLEDATRDSLSLSPSKSLNLRNAEITRLAERTGVSIDSLQPQDMIRDAKVPVQPLELTGTADADDAAVFLQELGEAMPDIHVQLIEMSSVALGSDRVRLRLTLYWFVDPAGES
jgi:hypothetical protein